MKRIFLLVATNLAIVLVLSVSLRLLGVDRILDERGTGLNLTALLIFSAVLGFSGSLISLALSKVDRQARHGCAGHRAAARRRGGLARGNSASPGRRPPASACRRSASSTLPR